MDRPIEYTVLLEAPQTQTIQIRMRVRNVASPTLDVALPVWRQGKYAVINPSGTVHGVRAETKSGRPLAIEKIDKTTWRIHTEDALADGEAIITYTVYANSLADRTRHVDDSHAFLSGATVFLYLPDRRTEPVSVRIDGPADWKIASGLKHAAGDPRMLLAPSYDVLIDSPIEAGLHQTLCFEVDGKPHEIVIWGDARCDPQKIRRDFATIVKKEAEIFGDIPYERYVFIIHAVPGLHGGTEHLNSTIIQTPPAAFDDDGHYKRLLVLAAHEMFHTWNVKRLRPAALVQPDLTRENYTDLLWFCEGTTAYYDALVVVRAGLETADDYLKAIAATIYQMRARPGARIQSVAESSFDAWIKFNHPTANDVNSTVSFYDCGALASLLLDLELRQRTQNKASLDTLLGEMYRESPVSGPGFTGADLIAVADRISQTRFDKFFERFIYGTERYPFEDVIEVVGLEMVVRDDGPKPYIGLALQDKSGNTVVRSVLSDGPAYLAGVNPGDEIVTLNGRKLSAAELMSHLEKHMQPGEAVQLNVLRRNRQRTIDFQLGIKPNPRWDFARVSAATPDQRAAYASWLGQPWPD